MKPKAEQISESNLEPRAEPVYGLPIDWVGECGFRLMDTEFKHWETWKTKCNLRECDTETQAALLQFIRKRAYNLVMTACGAKHFIPPNISELDGWYWWDLFEIVYIIRESKTQKKYKDGLFYIAARAQNDPADAMERQVCTYFKRDVLREFMKDHCPQKQRDVPLDEPLSQEESEGETRKDQKSLDGDATRDTVTLHETEQLAGDYANWLFKEMNRRERVAVAATYLNLAHSTPEVERAAGCKKSVLRTAYLALFTKLTDRLKRDFPEETAENLIRLGFYVFEVLKEKSHSWAKRESYCKGFLNLMGDRTASGNER